MYVSQHDVSNHSFLNTFKLVLAHNNDHEEERMSDTISPYSASASPKIRIRIIPTNILSCCALARTPASPTIPIDNPAAYI
jgi:hypothetical protein